MMKINRISRIKDHRIFRDFTWPADLEGFSQFNLIFGWNGSGKTTLSNLFRYMEKHQALTEGEVLFQIDGNNVSGSTFPSNNTSLPQVKVFNRDFISANVFATHRITISPIFFLGEDSIEKQKQIESLNIKLGEERDKIAKKQSELTVATNALDTFCIYQAKSIKDLLSSSGQNPYNNYHKGDFRSACDVLDNNDPSSKLLSEKEKDNLKRKKESTPKEILPFISLPFPDLSLITQDVKLLMERTVLSQVIEELAKDSILARWVREGIDYHTGGHESETCHFCGQSLPPQRIEKLQGHFNDEYNRFLAMIGDKIAELDLKQKEMSINFPVKAALYEHLSNEYSESLSALSDHLKRIEKYLDKLINGLREKQSKPFEAMVLSPSPLPDIAIGSRILTVINNLIEKHNAQTNNFQNEILGARKQLEECLIAEVIDDFKAKSKTIEDCRQSLQTLRSFKKQISTEIAEFEAQVIEHRRPAEELNAELIKYLGRDELKFEVLDTGETGYSITRNGVPVIDLSESEKTAIAFLYFLKSLKDKKFNLRKGIVVIDDPVSSLDTNSLFCAFGYLKEKTKEAGQLFVLTHNSTFFRQVKNWYNHLPGQRKKDTSKHPAQFFMILSSIDENGRNSSINRLDPLLHQFDSEYHFLFKLVHDAANITPGSKPLECFYGLPNIGRRLLETFLSFRYPSKGGDLWNQLNDVVFDPAQKARIIRFLHTYSHEGKIGDPEHDLSILAETPQVLNDLLELIKSEDEKHFEEMVSLINPPQSSGINENGN